jgi:hypothetical protein
MDFQLEFNKMTFDEVSEIFESPKVPKNPNKCVTFNRNYFVRHVNITLLYITLLYYISLSERVISDHILNFNKPFWTIMIIF